MWNYLYNNHRWLYNILRKPVIFYKNYFVEETHIYRTGVKRGKYADHAYRLPCAMRNAFMSFIDEITNTPWNEDKSTKELLLWEEKHNHMKDLYDTYQYVKYRRDELVELENELLSLTTSDLEMYSDDEGHLQFKRGPNCQKYSDLHLKVEVHLHEMDERYLHKIVDLIPDMWT